MDLESIKTDTAYIRKQLTYIREFRAMPSAVTDCAQRAMDALERIEEQLAAPLPVDTRSQANSQ